MATNADRVAEKAQTGFPVRYLPVGLTTWDSDISTSTALGPFSAGDWVGISINAATHVNAGAVGGSAGATNPQLPVAGVYDWTVKAVDGVTDGAIYVHLKAATAGGGVVWKVS